MEFKKIFIDGPLVIQPDVYGDHRGYFFESYSSQKFADGGLDVDFLQDNQSMSHKGVLRGLHFQRPPHDQGKLVRVISGSVQDVIVDIRIGSPTYGKSYSIVLTGENKTMFWVPPGFAHGFCTLEDHTVFSYKCTDLYHVESEGGLMYNDPLLNIDWMLNEVELSGKDKDYPSFSDFVSPFTL
ncbi:MAG: dTDP-4-dehydrorhamnose 3,5-epimerase [Bacteroidia bacterium]|nr:dTDP-4-dehydrorhamnose 3,5-epimerase [Bacteroidia bacterium]